MNNTVCRNFNYNEKADGILEQISLNCDKCEFDDHCDIKTAYHKAKDYAVSVEFHCWVKEEGNKEKTCCIDCKFFNNKEFYADSTNVHCVVAWGSCINGHRNITSTDPYTEVPSWCPLKGDEDERRKS